MTLTKRHTFLQSAVPSAKADGWKPVGDPFTVKGDMTNSLFQRMEKSFVISPETVSDMKDAIAKLEARIEEIERKMPKGIKE